MRPRAWAARAAAVTLSLVASTLVLPGLRAVPATAATVDTVAVPGGGSTQGIGTVGDGSVWTGVQAGAASTLARIAPNGKVTSTPQLGGAPAAVAGVGGKIWATIPSLHEIVVVDPNDPAALTTIQLPGHCGPFAIVDGQDANAYVSLPTDSSCTSEIAKVPLNGMPPTFVSGLGTAYALAVGSDSLFVPDFDGDQVRRVNRTTLTTTATYTAPPGSKPSGIAAAWPDTVVTAYYGSGGVGSVRVSAGSGPLSTMATGLVAPFGVLATDDDIYVAGADSVLIHHANNDIFTPLPAGARAHDLVALPYGAVWVSDESAARVFRLTSYPPRVRTGVRKARVTATGARVRGTVNPGGEKTTTMVQFGRTTRTRRTAAGPVLTGTGDQKVTVALSGLKPATTYYYYVAATNYRGTFGSDGRSFTTRLGADVRVAATPVGKRTRIGRIAVDKLTGKEKITVNCPACPASSRKHVIRAGMRVRRLTLGALSGVTLPGGTTLVVTVTRTGVPGVRTTLVTRAGKKPSVTTQTVW